MARPSFSRAFSVLDADAHTDGVCLLWSSAFAELELNDKGMNKLLNEQRDFVQMSRSVDWCNIYMCARDIRQIYIIYLTKCKHTCT